MDNQVFDLTTAEGRKEYIEHVFRQLNGKTDPELQIQVARLSLLNNAMLIVHEWFALNFAEIGMTLEEFKKHEGALVQQLLQTTAQTSFSDVARIVEKLSGKNDQ